MELILFLLVMFIWLQHRLYTEPIPGPPAAAVRVGTWWKVTFKAKKTPPLEIEGATEPLVLRALMGMKINYRDIASVEQIP